VAATSLGALEYLGLGRAYAMAGEPAQARTAYREFFTRWRGADADVPVLMQAKREYAELG